MRKTKLYILLTLVLLSAASSILGFCGLGEAMAVISTRGEEEKELSEKVGQIFSGETANFSEEFFEFSLKHWTLPNSISNSSSQSRISYRRIPVPVMKASLASHFICHKYFNHAAFPFVFLSEPSFNRHYLQRLRVLII